MILKKLLMIDVILIDFFCFCFRVSFNEMKCLRGRRFQEGTVEKRRCIAKQLNLAPTSNRNWTLWLSFVHFDLEILLISSIIRSSSVNKKELYIDLIVRCLSLFDGCDAN